MVPSDVTHEAPTRSSVQARRPLWIIIAALVLAVLVLGTLLLTSRSELNTANEKIARSEQKAVKTVAKEAPRADLTKLSRAAFPDDFYQVTDLPTDERSITLVFSIMTSSRREGLRHLLVDRLGFPSGIMSRIGLTRAVDGTLSAKGDRASATWTYHPDSGLNMVIQDEQP